MWVGGGRNTEILRLRLRMTCGFGGRGLGFRGGTNAEILRLRLRVTLQ